MMTANMIISTIDTGWKNTCLALAGAMYVSPLTHIIAPNSSFFRIDVANAVNIVQNRIKSIASQKSSLNNDRTLFKNSQKS